MLDVRALKVSDGMDDSVGAKLDFLIYYLSNEESWLYTLFGHFNMESVSHYLDNFITMDSEWGYAIFNYGWVFFVLIIVYYWQLAQKLKGKYSIMTVCLVIWSLSATVLFSLSASVAFFFVLSIYANRSEEEFFMRESN